jgi:DNA-binding NarL/FixJ family response regulator
LMDFFKLVHPAAPVIVYTGRQRDDEIVRGLLAKGAQRYLHKDGSLEGLLAAVKEACG